jgi:hypothetical protein
MMVHGDLMHSRVLKTIVSKSVTIELILIGLTPGIFDPDSMKLYDYLL